VRQLEQFAADAFVVVAYGRILPPDILAIPRLGVVNIHPSLLPRRRGPSPVAAAILEGDAQTGVTLMLLDEGMDSGPLLLQPSPVLLDGSERTGELTARLFEIGAQQLSSVLDMLDSGTITPRQQDESAATVTRLVEKADGEIDWSKPAIEIERMTRAYDPWPGAFTSLNGKGLKITGATLLSGADGVAAGGKSPVPGTVSVRAHRLFVATGEGELEILQAQPEGRKPMSARDLLNGQPGLSGAVLGR
jgi:methionyl-tRNA formyltransferase